jgi:uncharacterized protein YbjT (DUF2867 family)
MGASIRCLFGGLGLLSLLACSPADDGATDDAADTAETPVQVEAPVLVFGATGGTGRRVVTQLLAQGRSVRAFVRDEASAREKLGNGVEYVTGDVREPATVRPAVAGVKLVISAIGSSGRSGDPSNSAEAVDFGGVKTIADEAAAAGVEHMVLVSSMGASVEDHPLNQMFDNVLRWKFKGEEALRNSGMPYTIIRAGGLTEETGGESEIRIFAEDAGEGRIPRADVASVCVAVLNSPAAMNKTLSVISGEGAAGNDLNAAIAAIAPDA